MLRICQSSISQCFTRDLIFKPRHLTAQQNKTSCTTGIRVWSHRLRNMFRGPVSPDLARLKEAVFDESCRFLQTNISNRSLHANDDLNPVTAGPLVLLTKTVHMFRSFLSERLCSAQSSADKPEADSSDFNFNRLCSAVRVRSAGPFVSLSMVSTVRSPPGA